MGIRVIRGTFLEYEPLSCLLGIGKKGGSNFFENHSSTVYGCIWGEIFFFENRISGVTEGDGIRGIVFIEDSI